MRCSNTKGTCLSHLVALLAVTCLPLMGCSITTSQAVKVQPVASTLPVSLSGFYRDTAGVVVTPDDYRIAKHVHFSKTYHGSLGEETSTTLDLTDDFRRELDDSGGEAVVNVVIRGESFDSGSTSGIGTMKVLGTGWVIGGSVLAAGGAVILNTAGDEAQGGGYIMAGAGLALGLSGAILLISAASKRKSGHSEWKITVDADVAQRLRPSVPASVSH